LPQFAVVRRAEEVVRSAEELMRIISDLPAVQTVTGSFQEAMRNVRRSPLRGPISRPWHYMTPVEITPEGVTFVNSWGRGWNPQEIADAEAEELADSHDEDTLDRGADSRLREAISKYGIEACFEFIDPEDLIDQHTRSLWASRNIEAIEEHLCHSTTTTAPAVGKCSTTFHIPSPRPVVSAHPVAV